MEICPAPGTMLATVARVRVEFSRSEEKGRLACTWVATLGRRTRVPGPWMPAGRDLPHDLAQYVVEAATGCPNGFWGLVAKGATFRSTGRRPTKPGRALIAAHRVDLDAAEDLAGLHLATWKAGGASAVTTTLDAALVQWRALTPTDRLVFEWPAALGEIQPAETGLRGLR